jgi:hypothetical protein
MQSEQRASLYQQEIIAVIYVNVDASQDVRMGGNDIPLDGPE